MNELDAPKLSVPLIVGLKEDNWDDYIGNEESTPPSKAQRKIFDDQEGSEDKSAFLATSEDNPLVHSSYLHDSSL